MKTFKQFIAEAKDAKPDALDTIMNKWQQRPGYEGLVLNLSREKVGRGKPNISLNDLWVPKHLRGRRVGSRILRGLSRKADNENATISLIQKPEKGREEDLNRFYSGYNFRPATSRNRRASTPLVHTHIRLPKAQIPKARN